ncbi:MAG: hypothetical protein J6C56_01705 [Alistipes sp.]|nr:hypothetical protein [Alistipes sp.]
MRKLFSLLSIALVALVAVGCDKGGDDQSTSGVTFEFQNAKTTATSAEVQIIPSDATVNYVAAIVESATIADKSDADIINEMLAADDLKLKKGPQYLVAQGLKAGTKYSAIAFAVTETKKVARYTLTTETATDPIPADEFEIEIEIKDIKATSATAIAKPNTSANRYYFRVITKMELDAFGIYNDDYQIFEYIIENPNSGDWITQGETTLNCRLVAETDYLAVAFNFENWEDMHNQTAEMKLFRKAFTTPEGEPIDPNSLFVTDNLTTTHTNFSLDVTPALGEDAHWTYYIWTKKSYEQTLATEAKANIVMRSYFGLNNIAVEQGYGFGDIIQTDKLGKKGSNTITAYEPLNNNTEYVVVLFYVDPTITDPTEVYDYNYVAVEFKTQAPSADTVATLEVSEPIIVKDGFSYAVNFVVKTNEYAVDLLAGAQLWNGNCDFEKYWDPNDWSQIQAFFVFRKPVGEETLAAAKSAEGATISFTGFDKEDYVFFFEVLNAENTATQFAVRVTPDMFDNAQ